MNLNYYYSSYFGGDGQDLIYSVDCRLDASIINSEEFVMVGMMDYSTTFPYSNIYGNADYFTTSSHPSGINGFVSDFTWNCQICARVGESVNENSEFKVFAIPDAIEILLPENNSYEKYKVVDLLGRTLIVKKISDENSLFIPNKVLKDGITIISIFDSNGNQKNIKLPIHE